MGDGMAFGDTEGTIDLDMNIDEVIETHFSYIALLHFSDHQILAGQVSDAAYYFFGGGGIHDFIDGGS